MLDSRVGPSRSPSRRSTWKKRVRALGHGSSTSQVQTIEPPLDKKRSFDQIKDVDHGLTTDHSKKSRTSSGVVSSNDPLSVAAVGQPRRSQ